jgi:hypothetical protein
MHLLALLIVPVWLAAGQTPPDPPAPADDSIAVTGCVSGSMLIPLDENLSRGGRVSARDRYRLTGRRALIRQLRRGHGGHLVEITGRLTPPPGGDGARVGRIGGTDIRIGVGQNPRDARQLAYDPERRLEVLSWKTLPDRCPPGK